MAKSRRERHEQKKGEGGPLWRRRAKRKQPENPHSPVTRRTHPPAMPRPSSLNSRVQIKVEPRLGFGKNPTRMATGEELETTVRKVESDGDGYVNFCELTGLSAKSIDSDEVSENLKWACSRSLPTKCRDGYRDRLILEKRNRMYKMVLPLELSDLEAGEEEACHMLLRA
ncbi:Pyruvate decarboxylase 3 [Sarracenia purpurea var. burkii]